MNELEMLMLAAKAAGLKVIIPAAPPRGLWIEGLEDEWNPLNDDGDALRLAADLGITIYTNIRTAYVLYGNHPINADDREITATEEPGEDPHAATRRAIVRAAAQIGEHMEKQNGN